MSATLDHGWWPWVALVVFAFLPSEIWRLLSLVVVRRLDPRSEWLRWVRAVATGLLAGVIAKLLFTPSETLGALPLWARLGALAFGMIVFAATRRSVVAAILAGEAMIVTLGYWLR